MVCEDSHSQQYKLEGIKLRMRVHIMSGLYSLLALRALASSRYVTAGRQCQTACCHWLLSLLSATLPVQHTVVAGITRLHRHSQGIGRKTCQIDGYKEGVCMWDARMNERSR